MSQSLNDMTDPLEIARAIMADPRKRYTVSTLQIMAICKALDQADLEPASAITDGLALAARALIAIHDGFAERADAQGLAVAHAVSDAAFKAFKTEFETEFPE